MLRTLDRHRGRTDAVPAEAPRNQVPVGRRRCHTRCSPSAQRRSRRPIRPFPSPPDRPACCPNLVQAERAHLHQTGSNHCPRTAAAFPGGHITNLLMVITPHEAGTPTGLSSSLHPTVSAGRPQRALPPQSWLGSHIRPRGTPAHACGQPCGVGCYVPLALAPGPLHRIKGMRIYGQEWSVFSAWLVGYDCLHVTSRSALGCSAPSLPHTLTTG